MFLQVAGLLLQNCVEEYSDPFVKSENQFLGATFPFTQWNFLVATAFSDVMNLRLTDLANILQRNQGHAFMGTIYRA